VPIPEEYIPLFDRNTTIRASLRRLDRDSSIATFWYSRARDLGATGVASRLKSLEAK